MRNNACEENKIIYFMKPFPEEKVDVSGWNRFIGNDWFNKNYMNFVYALQIVLLVLPFLLGWTYSGSILIRILLGVGIFLTHEILHFVCIVGIGDVSLPLVGDNYFDLFLFVAWLNAIIAGSDILNSVLILIKPGKAKFYRGYYIIEK